MVGLLLSGAGARGWVLVAAVAIAVTKTFDQLGDVITGAWRGKFELGAVADDLRTGIAVQG